MKSDKKPTVSVVSIALDESEFAPMLEALGRQTYQDFEFIGEAGGDIPEAWNRAIRRARGEILVFTETDAKPVNQRWLEELVSSLTDERTILKGLEVTGSPWDLSNLACYRSVFENNRFDEHFKWAEDTELLCRLKSQGYHLVQLDQAPVVHLQKYRSKSYIRRAFQYGLYWGRLRQRYVDPVDLGNVRYAGKTLICSLLNLLGLLVGILVYWPERRFRREP